MDDEQPHVETIDYVTPGTAAKDGGRRSNDRVVGATRITAKLLVVTAAFYMFLLLGWGGSEIWLLMMIAMGWCGLGVTAVGIARLKPEHPYRLAWLNAGIILLWSRFWLEISGFARSIVEEWAFLSDVRFFTWADLIPVLPCVLLVVVTILVIRLNLNQRRNIDKD